MIGKFVFIGQDGSMGYKKNKTYRLNVLVNDQFILAGIGKNFLYEVKSPEFLPIVPYASWKAFYRNWKLV